MSGARAEDVASSSFFDPVEIGGWREIDDGLVRINLPVPFRGLKQVNLWLLRDGDGWAMIDCGWGDEETRETIETVWREALGGRPVTRLIVTHFHPDHMGNSRWICDRWSIRPEMTRTEWMAGNLALRGLYSDDLEFRARFFKLNGIDPELLEVFRHGTILYHLGVEMADDYTRLRDGEDVMIDGDSWRLITGGGHSPEMATLYCGARGIYIAGDQLLPKITTNISVWPAEPCARPLSEFLSSLDRIAAIVDDAAVVLPSHRDPFRGARARIRELHGHHDERLDLLRAAIRERGSISAGESLAILFRPELDGHQVSFAMGEALAHLNHLVELGEADRIEYRDGTIRFAASRN